MYIGIFCFVVGALVVTLINHLRWGVFPISGGPKSVNAWLGGPSPLTQGEDPLAAALPVTSPSDVLSPASEDVQKTLDNIRERSKILSRANQTVSIATQIFIRQVRLDGDEAGVRYVAKRALECADVYATMAFKVVDDVETGLGRCVCGKCEVEEGAD